MTQTYGFVLGTGRCGSTLVQELVARHRGVGFLSNVEDRFALPAAAGRFNRGIYQRVPARFTEKGRARFAPSEGYRALDRLVSQAVSTPMHDLTAADATPWLVDRFRAFFTERAEAQGAPVFLHKFTGWPRVGFVDAAFPGTRFVHVVRDGRAVASSWLQMSWWKGYEGPAAWQWGPLPAEYEAEWEAGDRSFVLLAGLLWKLLIDAFEQAQKTLGDDARWLAVRYEDVVAEPVPTLRRVAEHLCLDWSRELEASVTAHPFNPKSATRWQQDLSDAHVAMLTKSLGAHLERFNYAAV